MTSFDNTESRSIYKPSIRQYCQTTVLALIIFINLLVTAILLIVWKYTPINETNVHYALIGAAFLCLFFLIFIICALKYYHSASTKNLHERVIEVQIVYPTPEQKYLTGTLLSRLVSSNQPHTNLKRGSSSSRTKTATESLSSASVSRGPSKSSKSVKSVVKSSSYSSSNASRQTAPPQEEPQHNLDHLSFSSCEEDNCSEHCSKT